MNQAVSVNSSGAVLREQAENNHAVNYKFRLQTLSQIRQYKNSLSLIPTRPICLTVSS